MDTKRVGVIFDSEWTRIVTSNKGKIYDDLTLVCWNELTSEVVVLGKDAKKMIDRVDKPLRVIAPLAYDSINNLEVFKAMVTAVLNKHKYELNEAELIITAPGIENENLQNIFYELLSVYTTQSITFVPKIILTAVGANTNINDEYGTIILDINYYNSTVAIIADGEVVATKQSKYGEKWLDEEIVRHLKEVHGLVPTLETIENIKWTLGTVIKSRHDLELNITGRDLITNERMKIIVTDADFKKIFITLFNTYRTLITSVLEECPIYLRTSVVKNGLKITGELAGIIGVKDFFEDFFDFPAKTAKNRGYAAADGAIKWKI
ncbi:rod shape-determining protein [Mesoplasma photuris]|uniref:rod shape-determining protein n=1 Tax=Mesoplasma photuris TaxID=217731 RepID=UPI0004E24D7A|nr:rod shape-determining protein [Mesoplasma photuris]